jgi:hypothetical protein
MASFLYPALLWGLPVIAVPVLIHLINMLRHRRVQWAAMEFLLLSQKKHRTWIILKQLLLLLLRMLAVAAVVLIVAQPRVRDRWGSLLGTDKTHHIILLDDSFSMSDHWADTSAFTQAKLVVERIGVAAVRQKQPQSVTLLRFSRAGQYGGGLQADFTKEPVDAKFSDKLSQKLEPIRVSETAAEPAPALEAISQLLGDEQGERQIVYLISDFRARQWDDATELRKRLLDLNQSGTEVRLVDCVEASHANLAIVSLAPDEGIRAAGIDWGMVVAVQNFGQTTVENVSVVLTADGRARPGVSIAKIPPGRVVKERFTVRFDTGGEHQVKAQLDADAVLADNLRYAVVDLSKDMPVLLIDSDPGAKDARMLNWALAPGDPVRTGVRPRIETPRFLAAHPLDEFRTITLTNVDRLDRTAVDALEKYVAAGGGLAVFVGQQSALRFLNDDLYHDGKGLFPLPVAGPAELLVDRLEKAPDISADEHFLFRSFQDKRNEMLSKVLVERYMAAPKGWKPPADSTTRVIARLRNGAPLIVEKSFGKGRVVAILTTAAPEWNNWARERETGTFPAVLRDMQAYLSLRPAAGASNLVGTPMQLRLPAGEYEKQVRFATPKEDITPSATVDAVLSGDQMTATLAQTDQSGFYAAQLTTSKGGTETRYYAVNVDPLEGNLQAMFEPDLRARLPDAKFEFAPAATFQSDNGDLSGYNLSQALLLALVLLLIGEQVLAWSCSYHPASRGSLGRRAEFSPLHLHEGRGDDGELGHQISPGAASPDPTSPPPRSQETGVAMEGGAR